MYNKRLRQLRYAVGFSVVLPILLLGCGSTVTIPNGTTPRLGANASPVQLAWAVTFSPDGQKLAVGYGGLELLNPPDSLGTVIRIWNLQEHDIAPVVLQGHENTINAVGFSPNGNNLASASSDGTVRLWNLQRPAISAVILRTVGAARALAFSPDGYLLAAGGGEDKKVRLWDVRQPDRKPVLLDGDAYTGQSLSFSIDGSMLAAAEQGGVRIWSMKEPQSFPTLLKSDAGPVWAVAFSPKVQTLAEGGVGQTIRLWDLHQWLTPAHVADLTGHEATIRALAFSPDGHMLASCSNDTTIRLWDMDHPQAAPIILRGHAAPVQSVAFSPDGHTLASVGGDAKVRLWDTYRPNAVPTLLSVPELP